jgi:hypothetical protein
MLAIRRSQVISTPVALTAAAIAAATVGYSYSRYSSQSAPAKVFGKGPAFTSLRLDSVETLSHDTKRFRFALPSETTVSGLEPCCEFDIKCYFWKLHADWNLKLLF